MRRTQAVVRRGGTVGRVSHAPRAANLWEERCGSGMSWPLARGGFVSTLSGAPGRRVSFFIRGPAADLARRRSAAMTIPLATGVEAVAGLVLSRRYAQQSKKVGGLAYRPRVFIPSLGQIADPVVPPSGADLLSPAKLWTRVRSVFMNLASLWQVRKQLKKEKYAGASWFILGRWTAEAAKQYSAFCEARANGNGKTLRTLTTDEFFDVIKNNTIEPSSKLHREWDLQNLRAKVLALRMIALQEPDVKFAQMLVRFTSQQKFKITDGKGKLVAGNETSVPITEYYVLERPLQDVHLFGWKFMGKLDPNRKEPLTKPMLEQ